MVVHEVTAAVAETLAAVPPGAAPGGTVANVLAPTVGQVSQQLVRAAPGETPSVAATTLAPGASRLPPVPSSRLGQVLRTGHTRADPVLTRLVPSSAAAVAMAVAPAVPT